MVRHAPRERTTASFFDNLARSRRVQHDSNFVPSDKGSFFDGPRHARRVPCPKTCYDPSAGAPPTQHVRQFRTNAPTEFSTAATTAPSSPATSVKSVNTHSLLDIDPGACPHMLDFQCESNASSDVNMVEELLESKALSDVNVVEQLLPYVSEVLEDTTEPEGVAPTANDPSDGPAWDDELHVCDTNTVAAILGIDKNGDAAHRTCGSDHSFIECALNDRYAKLFAHETLEEDDNARLELPYKHSNVITHRFRLSDYANLYSGDVLVAHGRHIAGPTPRLRPCSTWKRGRMTTHTTWGKRDGPFFVPLWFRQLEIMKNASHRNKTRSRAVRSRRRVVWADSDTTTPLARAVPVDLARAHECAL
jgi:hypothetical protein